MDTGDQSKEKVGLPNLPMASFQWGAALSAVKDQIPSMDSDNSMSDGDEDGDLFIFQRDLSNLIPDLSEELEGFSSGKTDLQSTATFTSHLQELRNESFQAEESAPQSSSKGHFIVDRDGFGLGVKDPPSEQDTAPLVFPPCEHESDEGIPGTRGEKDPVAKKGKETWGSTPDKAPSVEGSTFLSGKEKQSEIDSGKGRGRLTETKIVSKGTPKNNNNNVGRTAKGTTEQRTVLAKYPREITLFALEDIEKWDLDKVLRDLETQSAARGSQTAEEAAFPSADHETRRAASQAKLMGKLKELSLKQSRAFFLHRRRRLAKFPRFNEGQGDGRDVPCLAPSTNGQSSIPVDLQYPPEPPTVHIDLRDTKSQDCELLAEEAQSSSDSSTDSEEDTKAEGREKAKERVEEFPQLPRKDCTGKSFLLQQLRHFRQRMSQVPTKGSETVARDGGRGQDLGTAEETSLLKVRERRRLKWRGLAPPGSAPSDAIAKSVPSLGRVISQTDSSGDPKKEIAEGSISETTQASLEDKGPGCPRTEGDQVEKRAREKQRRQRLRDQLEGSKPQLSVTGKQPMAEQTPILFHAEVSYLAPIRTLPTPKGSQCKMLQMTIGLSSCGCVSPGQQQRGSFLETSSSAANIYPAVVTWLLSLVPCLGGKGESKAPFHVSGLQQTWHKGSLALRACLTPVCESDGQSVPGLQEREPEEGSLQRTSPFHQQTAAFLSETSLRSVIWWEAELAGRLQDQPYPFLPEIPDICLSDIAAVDSDPQAVEEACAVPAGFYWQTVETDEKYFTGSSDIKESGDTDTEVAMALLLETLLRNPRAVHHMLQLVLASGLDICGLRLLYPPHSMLLSSAVTLPPSYAPEKELPVLAVSLRGSNARGVLQDIVGPSDPRLASVTDSCSINASYCASPAQPLVYLPRTDGRVHRELCVWFGGRVCHEEVPCGGAQHPVCKCRKRRPLDLQWDADQGTSNWQDMAPSTPPAALVSTTKGDVILVASPTVPPYAYGSVISTCTQRGFVLQGVEQLRLSPGQASWLGMSANQVAAFCPCEASGLLDWSGSGDSGPVQPRRHCLILLLRKENASHHVPALLKGLMNGLAEKGFWAEMRSSLPPGVQAEPGRSFHAAPYTDSLLQALGGSFCTTPDPCHTPLDILRPRRYTSDPDMEQIVLLTQSGKEAMKMAGEFLHPILALGYMKEAQAPVSNSHDQRFELLALKWLPRLTRTQAKETTPFEVGEKHWHTSVDALMSGPALVCALRRVGAFVGLAEILKPQTLPDSKPKVDSGKLWRVMSSTPEMAYRQAALFFAEKDFVGDPKCRPALKYLPPPARRSRSKGDEIQTSSAESLFRFMQAGAEVLCTVLLIKPGVWTRNLPRILRKLDLERFRLVGMKHLNLIAEDAKALLSPEDEESLQAQSAYLTSGSSFALCLQRENAVKKLLDLLGPEDAKRARAANPSFWRAQYGVSSVQNGLYGSVSYCVAVRDIRLFFPEGLCGADCLALEEEEIGTLTSDPALRLETGRRRRLVKCERRRPAGFEQPQSLERPHLAALCQTTCLILPTSIGQGARLQLLGELVSKNFLVAGARLTAVDQSQACFITAILNVPESEASSTCSALTEGPCLVLAVQRDNAVVCFDILLNGLNGIPAASTEGLAEELHLAGPAELPKLSQGLISDGSSFHHARARAEKPLALPETVQEVQPRVGKAARCAVKAPSSAQAFSRADLSLLILFINHPGQGCVSDHYQKRPALDCMQHLLYPRTEKQAEELLCCLFDYLTSDSIHQIETHASP